MFIPREERAARNVNCLNSSACFSEFRLPPGAAAAQWILFNRSWRAKESLNWLVAFLYWNYATIDDDCDAHWQSFGSTWNPNLISLRQRAALKLNCVRLTTEGAGRRTRNEASCSHECLCGLVIWLCMRLRSEITVAVDPLVWPSESNLFRKKILNRKTFIKNLKSHSFMLESRSFWCNIFITFGRHPKLESLLVAQSASTEREN